MNDVQIPLFITLGVGALALVFAFIKTLWVNKQDGGTDYMKEIGGHIRDGAMAFLKKEYSVLAIFVVVVAALLAWAKHCRERQQQPAHRPVLRRRRGLLGPRGLLRHARGHRGELPHDGRGPPFAE